LGLTFRKRLYGKILRHVAKRLFLPPWARIPFDIWQSLRYLRRAALSLRGRKLGVAVLDGAAISGAMLQGDCNAASSVMFLLGLSELLEEHTRAKARGALAGSLTLNVDTVWVRRGGADTQIQLERLCTGDLVVVRTGSVISVDGVVASGEASVNQAMLTGEPGAVFKRQGDSVFAGTLLEEGCLIVEARAVASESRISRIVQMIDESDSLKAGVQNRAECLADRIVPFNFLLAAGAFLLGGARAAMSALLVDYSCAVKLATPIAVLSALREASANRLAVRGGKFLEAAAEADTVIFDKTGTLTAACPTVSYVGAFDSFTRDKVLQTAACIEEHFPHSLARAVVRRAKEEGLLHEEDHADVEYIAAHGIVTSYSGCRVVIGSRHFIEDDEGISITAEQESRIEREAKGGAVLYLGVDGTLAGFICIADPPRPEAAAVITQLKSLGV
jgi:P-type E1-E2 ATPase